MQQIFILIFEEKIMLGRSELLERKKEGFETKKGDFDSI